MIIDTIFSDENNVNSDFQIGYNLIDDNEKLRPYIDIIMRLRTVPISPLFLGPDVSTWPVTGESGASKIEEPNFTYALRKVASKQSNLWLCVVGDIDLNILNYSIFMKLCD